MIIKNANVFTSDHRFVQGDVTVTGDRFSVVLEKADGDGQVVDAAGLYMIPGLVDILFHGCKGADMCDGTQEALDIITAYEAGVGVTWKDRLSVLPRRGHRRQKISFPVITSISDSFRMLRTG